MAIHTPGDHKGRTGLGICNPEVAITPDNLHVRDRNQLRHRYEKSWVQILVRMFLWRL
jgi:hypothetical protein